MNDFGIFQTLHDLVRRDQLLSQKITSVVTEPRPGMQPPYLQVRFNQVSVDIPCLVQSALVACEMQLTSTYHGDQEIHELMSRLNFLLDGASLPVQIRALGTNGEALFKQVGQDLTASHGARLGTLKYQVKVNIRRDE